MPAFLAPLIGGIATGVVGGLLGKGKKPSVPAYTPVDISREQELAISSNMAQAKGASELANVTNAYNQEELRRMLRASIPGYDEMIGKGSEVVQSFLSGELPDDVSAAIKRNTAEKAGAGGYGQSGFGRNLQARDLGITSLQLTQQGLDAASRWMQNVKALSVPQAMDVQSMFVTPAQRSTISAGNSANAFNQQWLGAQVAAAPDPTQAALGNLLTQIGGSLFGAGMQRAFSGPSSGPQSNPQTGIIWNMSGGRDF